MFRVDVVRLAVAKECLGFSMPNLHNLEGGSDIPPHVYLVCNYCVFHLFRCTKVGHNCVDGNHICHHTVFCLRMTAVGTLVLIDPKVMLDSLRSCLFLAPPVVDVYVPLGSRLLQQR